MYIPSPQEQFIQEMEKLIRRFRRECDQREGKEKRWIEERMALMNGLAMLRGKKYMVS